jgi:hypothetical protein
MRARFVDLAYHFNDVKRNAPKMLQSFRAESATPE